VCSTVTIKEVLSFSFCSRLLGCGGFSMATAAPVAAASHVAATLCSLSSDLLMHVSHWLDIKELCVFDQATASNTQLRVKYRSGLRNDSFLYPGADVDPLKTSASQEGYAQWLTMRHVFVNAIGLNKHTTPSVKFMYDTMNRINPGLVSLTIHHGVDFPKDMAVRNAKTLHILKIANYKAREQMRKVMASVREWESMGGSLQDLTLVGCKFDNEVVDFGNCDSLTTLNIRECTSHIITTPGDSLGCTRLLWGILHKCKNLAQFTFRFTALLPLNDRALIDRDLCLLARFCPHLKILCIESQKDETSEAALGCVAMKCTKLQQLVLHTQRTYADRTIQTIAANSVSLRTLSIKNLQLHNPRTLRCLGVGCPLLWYLYIEKGNANVTEAELLYLVEHAKKLQLLKIGKWEHLDFKASWAGLQPFAPEDLLQLGMEDPEALIASQRQQEMLQVLSAATRDVDTVDKLRAASKHRHCTVVLMG
jgi:hypothetical protein